MTEGANKKSPLMAVLIAGVVVVAALLGVIVMLLLGRGNGDPVRASDNAPQQRAIVVNEDNAEEVAEEIINEEPIPMGYYEVNMTSTWTFPDGQSPASDAYVENAVTNTNDVYFDVLLEADESVALYESPVLPRGTHISDITLAQDLDAGTYPCVIVYHLIDDQQNTISTLRVTMRVIVEN